MEFTEDEGGKKKTVQIIASNIKTWSFYSKNFIYCLIWAQHPWTPLSMTWGAVLGFVQKNTIKKRDVLELCF